MASWQAHVMSFVLRHTFKPRLARARNAIEARAVMNGGRFKAPPDVRITAATVGGVPGEWVEGEGGSDSGVLVYLHGGGYFACSARSHRPYTTFFARRGLRVFAPDYRLAPENPFPAAVEDAVAAYRGAHAANGRTVIGGDSAGGGLALATMLKLREDGDPLPAAAVLFSPLTDLIGTGKSRSTKRCAMFHGENMSRATEFYMAGGDPRQPLASPLYADLHGLPPLLIHVGADETLLDDSTQLAERAEAAGVRVDLTVWPVVPHVWQLFYQFVPEGRQSLEAASAYLRKALAGQPQSGNTAVRSA
jgi:monoterpene epsilon-lactone hydrolase